ncbi:hypothetical protein ACUXHH_001469 [Rothia sp. 110740021-2]
MTKKQFWLMVQRGSDIATLFLGLVEILRVISSCLY